MSFLIIPVTSYALTSAELAEKASWQAHLDQLQSELTKIFEARDQWKFLQHQIDVQKHEMDDATARQTTAITFLKSIQDRKTPEQAAAHFVDPREAGLTATIQAQTARYQTADAIQADLLAKQKSVTLPEPEALNHQREQFDVFWNAPGATKDLSIEKKNFENMAALGTGKKNSRLEKQILNTNYEKLQDRADKIAQKDFLASHPNQEDQKTYKNLHREFAADSITPKTQPKKVQIGTPPLSNTGADANPDSSRAPPSGTSASSATSQPSSSAVGPGPRPVNATSVSSTTAPAAVSTASAPAQSSMQTSPSANRSTGRSAPDPTPQTRPGAKPASVDPDICDKVFVELAVLIQREGKNPKILSDMVRSAAIRMAALTLKSLNGNDAGKTLEAYAKSKDVGYTADEKSAFRENLMKMYQTNSGDAAAVWAQGVLFKQRNLSVGSVAGNQLNFSSQVYRIGQKFSKGGDASAIDQGISDGIKNSLDTILKSNDEKNLVDAIKTNQCLKDGGGTATCDANAIGSSSIDQIKLKIAELANKSAVEGLSKYMLSNPVFAADGSFTVDATAQDKVLAENATAAKSSSSEKTTNGTNVKPTSSGASSAASVIASPGNASPVNAAAAKTAPANRGPAAAPPATTPPVITPPQSRAAHVQGSAGTQVPVLSKSPAMQKPSIPPAQ